MKLPQCSLTSVFPVLIFLKDSLLILHPCYPSTGIQHLTIFSQMWQSWPQWLQPDIGYSPLSAAEQKSGHCIRCTELHLIRSIPGPPALPPDHPQTASFQQLWYSRGESNTAKCGYCWWLGDWQRFPQAQCCPHTWQPLSSQLITWPSELISSQLSGPLPIGTA